jgi:hypothetical protein
VLVADGAMARVGRERDGKGTSVFLEDEQDDFGWKSADGRGAAGVCSEETASRWSAFALKRATAAPVAFHPCDPGAAMVSSTLLVAVGRSSQRTAAPRRRRWRSVKAAEEVVEVHKAEEGREGR